MRDGELKSNKSTFGASRQEPSLAWPSAGLATFLMHWGTHGRAGRSTPLFGSYSIAYGPFFSCWLHIGFTWYGFTLRSLTVTGG